MASFLVKIISIIIAACSLLFSNLSIADKTKSIRLLGIENGYHDGDRYFLDLVKLLISQPVIEGKYQIEFVQADKYFHGKTLLLVSKQLVDLTYTGATLSYSENTQQIKIPALAGLLGYRLLLVKKKDVDLFDQVETVEELREFKACQGHDWPDSDVLEKNGLTVIRVEDFDAMLRMLEAGKCDYFPRGLHESKMEMEYIGRHYPYLTSQQVL